MAVGGRIEGIEQRATFNRAVVLGATLLGVTLISLGCRRTFQPPPTPTYPLKPIEAPKDDKVRGVLLEDSGLDTHSYLNSLRFWYDPFRTVGGSLVMELDFKEPCEMRLATEELKPNPGWIYCMPHSEPKGKEILFPVVRFVSGDQELMHLGFRRAGEACSVGYQNMRAYLFERGIGDKLEGRFVGLKNLDPNSLTPRDQEAKGYFQKGCFI